MSNKGENLEVAAILNLLLSGRFVDCGELRISKVTLNKEGKERYLIYLPLGRSYLWKLIHSSGIKVKVFIELPQNLQELRKVIR
jgi:hypothetical protein